MVLHNSIFFLPPPPPALLGGELFFRDKVLLPYSEIKKTDNPRRKEGMGGRHAATTQGF